MGWDKLLISSRWYGWMMVCIYYARLMIFFENVFFLNNFCYRKGRKLILHHRVSLVKARRNMYSMILKGELQNLTTIQGHVITQVDPNRSYCTAFDAPWCVKHNEPIPMSVSLFNQKLLNKKKKTKKTVTLGDLKWPSPRSLLKTCTWDITNGQRGHDPERITSIWCVSLEWEEF